ncbi:hypothetical protein PIB30_036748 [Stylosanthes scabra]|uniref:Uncharacterized protein n=1 Tax=Stylosanthes scabra TaxID=79078 RepID=A0ABU6SDL9_9FABA|nr:hypothetical protein [Stylosanthes scabra]
MDFNSRSFRLSKSQRVLLSSESVNLECGGYERLSQSMRITGERDFGDPQRKHNIKKGNLGILSKFLSFTRTLSSSSSHHKAEVAAVKKKEKKRSAWLPDPQKRWPIQGWVAGFIDNAIKNLHGVVEGGLEGIKRDVIDEWCNDLLAQSKDMVLRSSAEVLDFGLQFVCITFKFEAEEVVKATEEATAYEVMMQESMEST